VLRFYCKFFNLNSLLKYVTKLSYGKFPKPMRELVIVSLGFIFVLHLGT